jgi:hypothetical protein
VTSKPVLVLNSSATASVTGYTVLDPSTRTGVVAALVSLLLPAFEVGFSPAFFDEALSQPINKETAKMAHKAGRARSIMVIPAFAWLLVERPVRNPVRIGCISL